MTDRHDDDTDTSPRILRPGHNCWRIPRAGRAAFLVDADDYFTAFHEAVSRARSTVYIAGWDLDSRLRLLRSDPERDVTLGDFLNDMAVANPDLRIRVLIWDFAKIYALEREPLLLFRMAWQTHRRVRMVMDGETPLGSSHHQKIVVVDDKVAFCGGLDLTMRRWDTRGHRARDPLRTDPGGQPYGPFHDVQMVVDGDAAASLGDIFRDRWLWATGTALAAPGETGGDPWPPGVEPDMRHVDVAVSRTVPAFKGREEVCEIKALYLDAIASARQNIYIENQYFTSSAVEQALVASLAEAHGPEVVIVILRDSHGWLEQGTMGALRANILFRLRKADAHGRLGVYWLDGHSHDGPLKVHGKVMVVDGRLARVGSANLNNRSMGLDTECDLAVEAADDETARAVAAFRNGLLAEHLDTTPERVAQALDAAAGSLLGAVEALREQGRLRPLTPNHSGLGELEAYAGVLDPEQPVALDQMMDDFVQVHEGDAPRAGYVKIAVAVALMAALAAAWRFTPLGSVLDMKTLVALAESIRNAPAAPLWVIGAFLAGSLVLFPVTVMVAATATVFSPWAGFAYALGGSLVGASATYGLGRAIGRDTVRRLSGERLNRLSKRLAQKGVVAVALVRLMPLAPFSVVNMVAGASRIRLRSFLAGTVLGMLPGIAMLTILADRLKAVFVNPNLGTVILAMVAVSLFALGAIYLKRRLHSNGKRFTLRRDKGGR